MNKTKGILAIVLVLLVAATAVYLKRQEPEQPTAIQRQAPAAVSPVEPAPEPAIRYPITPDTAVDPAPVEAGQPAPAETAPARAASGSAVSRPESEPESKPEPEPLPKPDDNDAALAAALDSVFGVNGYGKLLYADARVRRLVVSVDNLPGRQFPRSNYRVARSVPGLLRVTRETDGDTERLFLSPENYARYKPFIAIAENLDSTALVTVYRRFYPLFQAAYQNLGYPSSAYFNDRLVDVIDELLTTPEVTGRIELVRPHVLYRFADPDLERLSAGQKILLRVGPENAAILRTKLREIRHLLVGETSGN